LTMVRGPIDQKTALALVDDFLDTIGLTPEKAGT
jgi:hypothetical protein